MRLTWAQPEDLLAHELVQAAAEGKDPRRSRTCASAGPLRAATPSPR